MTLDEFMARRKSTFSLTPTRSCGSMGEIDFAIHHCDHDERPFRCKHRAGQRDNIATRCNSIFGIKSWNDNTYSGQGLIRLTSDLPLISQGTNFIGAGIGNTIIDGASTYRGFLISGIAADGQNAAPTNVTISGLSVQNVVAAGGAGGHGGGGGLGAGGAVFVGPAANLTLDNVSFSGATAVGGAAPGPTYNGYSAVGGGGGTGRSWRRRLMLVCLGRPVAAVFFSPVVTPKVGLQKLTPGSAAGEVLPPQDRQRSQR